MLASSFPNEVYVFVCAFLRFWPRTCNSKHLHFSGSVSDRMRTVCTIVVMFLLVGASGADPQVHFLIPCLLKLIVLLCEYVQNT